MKPQPVRRSGITLLALQINALSAQYFVEDELSVSGATRKIRDAANRRKDDLDAQEAEIAGQIFAHPIETLRDVQALIEFMGDRCSEGLDSDTHLRASFDALKRGVGKMVAG